MNKFADFRKEKCLRDQRSAELFRSLPREHKEKQYQIIKEILQLSIREQLCDDIRRNRLETEYYELLCKIARENGGRVELNLDDNLCFGTLTYWGNKMTIDSTLEPKISELTDLFKDSDTISISAAGRYFTLQLSFDLTDKKEEASYTDELHALSDRLWETLEENIHGKL